MHVVVNDYVYIRAKRPNDHLLKVRVVRIEDSWFLGEAAPGHLLRYDLARIVCKTHRDAPKWIRESTGEDATIRRQ